MGPLSLWDVVLLVLAGIGGGLASSIAGLASVTTYPALLLVGLPPVTANVTNTVALVANGVGSVWGSRPELAGQGARLKRVVPGAFAGGVAGAVLLLSIPSEGFENVVPVLLASASIAIALPGRSTVRTGPRSTGRTVLLGATILAICVYGGFFGAAAGVLLLALFLGMGSESLAHANATKNVVLGASNGAAALVFLVFGPVSWAAVVPLAIGCLIGSRLGPMVVRRAPATPMRLLIAVAGMALAVKLGLDAYR